MCPIHSPLLKWAKGASLKKLFVGNLPYQASEAELQDWFTRNRIPADSVQIIRDKFTGELLAVSVSRNLATTKKLTARFKPAMARIS